MIRQTIALFRYQLLGLINSKILLFLVVIYAVAFLGSRFVFELAIINSESIASAAMADFLRYSLVLLLIISVCHQISQDYELNQFDQLLATPIHRFQYVLAQLLVLGVFALFLSLPIFFLFVFLQDVLASMYWMLAVYLELILVGHFAILAAISLEKLPAAVIFTFGIYLLAKAAPLIVIIFAQSSSYYEEEAGFEVAGLLFSMIHYLMPDVSAFAQNDLLFNQHNFLTALLSQLFSVMVYGMFIVCVILLDFYRKEFNQT